MDSTSIADLDSLLKPSVKLTEWKKEPKLQHLKELFNECKSSHSDQMSKIQDWRDLMAASGKYKHKSTANRSSVQPKLIRRQAEWRYSALTEPFLGSDKLFQVNPTTFEDAAGAKQNELLLNWQFRTKMNKVKLIDDFVRATVDEGTAICRVGWNRLTKMNQEEVPVFEFYPLEPASEEDEEFMMLVQQLEQLAEFSQMNPREYNETVSVEMKEAVSYFLETGIPVQAVIVDYVLEDVEEILENHPTVEVLDPEDIYIDPTCKGDMDAAMFVVQVYETSKHVLMKQAGTYINLDKVEWDSAGVAPERNVENSSFKFRDSMKSKVTVFEYWGYHDIHDDGVMVPIVASWIGDTLIRLEESPFPDGKLPFVLVPYLPVKRKLYGEPDAELLRENQAISGAITRGMIDLLGRSANAQTGIPMNFLDTVNTRRFEGGLDYKYNPTNGMHPSNAVYTHKMPEIPNSAYDMLRIQSDDAESLSGIKAFSGGISGAAYGQVAAGIRGALDATSKREMAILRRLAKGVTEIGNKIIAMNSEFLEEVEVVRVTNTQFVEVLREDLKGNFDLIVDISTAEVDDAKSQDLAFMVQTIGPIAGPEAALQLVAEIADLKRMPDVANNLRNFRQEPSEAEQMMQELELKRMELEIAELESRIQVNMANAAKLEAEAEDKGNSTYERASGLTHKREIEKQKAQSQGNQNLTITKALTTRGKQGETEGNIEAAIGYTKLTELSGAENVESEDVDNQHSVRPVNNNQFMGV